MINSTLGFIYTPDFQKVLLITKQKPESHKGKLNGLGGKCEPNETAAACVSREIQEESGLEIPPEKWRKMGTLSWQEWHVEIFAAIYEGAIQNAHSETEEIAWYEVKNLPQNMMTNLQWLIPLGIDCLTNSVSPMVQIHYD